MKIREGEPSANPIEKVFIWRILRLLKLNIDLIFVNDGPRRPWKRNKRGGGRLDFELIRLTHQLLDQLKVPHHRAPGEAEAECARMQAMGIVDAVWSDDGDALMFGATTLIKQHKENGKPVKDHVRVYRADSILEKYQFDTDSLIMFAMTSGGDYNVEGLRGCGPKTASLVCKRTIGLARTLRMATQADLSSWRVMLQDALWRYGRTAVEVDPTFPDFKALGHYRNPSVSTPDQMNDLRGLRQGWDRRIDQVKLRVILRERFNFTTREFLKHLTPIFLSRALSRAKAQQRQENLAFEIELKE